MTAITSSGEGSIRKCISVSPLLRLDPDSDNDKYFEVDRCAEWIVSNQYTSVALQFPDELLHLSAAIHRSISQRLDVARAYILADSTYGSCCIDEKTAAHIQADALIHFGHSCGSSRKNNIPVLYVYVHPNVDLDQIRSDFISIYSDKSLTVGLLFDNEFHDVANRLLLSLLAGDYEHLVLIDTKNLENLDADTQNPLVIPWHIFYLTCTESAVVNRILQINRLYYRSNKQESNITPKISVYNPANNKAFQTPSIMKLLMKRSYYMEKLREALTVGILVGTLSVDNYMEVIRHLKHIIKSADKKCYVVSIGEISAPKLANFPDVNAFVLVACPETTLIESKEFYQVVVTPWEVEVAFGRPNHDATYFVDYRVLLPGSSEHMPFETFSSDKYSQVSLTKGMSNLGFSWHGIEEVPAEEFKVHQGQSGIAASYVSEPQVS